MPCDIAPVRTVFIARILSYGIRATPFLGKIDA
jgi:hypothetical protein